MNLVTTRTNWFVCERYLLEKDGTMPILHLLTESSQKYYDVVLPMSEVLQIKRINNSKLFALLKKIKSVHCLYIIVSDKKDLKIKDYASILKILYALLVVKQSRTSPTCVRMVLSGGNEVLVVSKGDNFSEYALPEQIITLDDVASLLNDEETTDAPR